ncbi:MAG: hypothetical protein WCQ26_11495 [Pseudanabaena sp. ELA748]
MSRDLWGDRLNQFFALRSPITSLFVSIYLIPLKSKTLRDFEKILFSCSEYELVTQMSVFHMNDAIGELNNSF